MQPRMENKSKLPAGDQPPWISPHEVLQFWLINAAYYLLVNNAAAAAAAAALLNSSQIEN